MKPYILCSLFFFVLFPLLSQEYHQANSYLFEDNQTGSHIYEAKESITLKGDFTYLPIGNESFTAKVNSKILFPDMSATYLGDNDNLTDDPSQGYAVGAIPGQFNVSPTGAATYTIPVEVLPGVNGMQPNIALSYNSQVGNGIAGWGWNISGLSSITRVHETFYHDGEATSTWGTAFSLNGNRMYEYDVTNSPTSIEYRSEVDNGERIIGYDITIAGPTYFKVWTKDGKEIKYGFSDNAQYRSTGFVLSWYIESIQDNFDNYISFNYSYSNHTLTSLRPDFRVNKITYGTSLEDVGLIEFLYESMDNSKKSYKYGFECNKSLRLSDIKVCSGATELKYYELNYSTVIDDKLISVAYTSGDTQIKKTSFDWTPQVYSTDVSDKITLNVSPKYTEIKASNYNDSFSFDVVATGDLDGDGVVELAVKETYGNKYWVSGFPKGHYEWEYKYVWVIYKSDGQSSTYNYLYEDDWVCNDGRLADIKSFYFLDTDNDGKDEFYCFIDYSSTSSSDSPDITIGGYVNGFELDGNNIISIDVDANLYSAGSRGGGGINSNTKSLIPGNFVGDGVIRFAQIDADNDFIGLTDVSNPQTSTIISGGDYDKYYLTDINGNGKSELMFVSDNGAYFYEYSSMSSSGCSFTKISDITSSDGVGYPKIFRSISLGDFNGDGLTDLLVDTDNHSYTLDSYYIWLSKGNGSFERIDLSDGLGLFGSSIYGNPPMVVDLNADGMSDLLMQTFEEVGDDFEYNLVYLLGDGKGDFINTYSESIDNNLGIFKASGKFYKHLSTCVRTSSDKLVVLNNGSVFNKIDEINMPYGDDVSITYAKQPKSISINVEPVNLCDEADGDYNSYALPDFILVDEVSSGSETIDYGFSYPINNKQGKGFLGFIETSVHSSKTDVTTTSVKELNSTYQLMLPKMTTIKDGTTEMSTSEQVYSFINTVSDNSKIFRLQLNYSIQKNKLNKSGSKTSYLSYDGDGNPTIIKSEYYDGENIIPNTYKQTTTLYTDEGSWCNYLPSTVTQTQASPEGVESHTTSYIYDGTTGSVTKKTTDSGEDFEVITTYSNYNTLGSPGSIAITTPRDGINDNNRLETLTYTTDERFLASKTSGGMTKNYTYYPVTGQLETKTAPSGLTSRYFYNGLGQKYKTLTHQGVESLTTLNWVDADNRGDATSDAIYYSYSKTSGIAETKTYFNAKGQIRRTVSRGFNNELIYSDKEYNSDDRLYRESQPYFKGASTTKWTTYAYNDPYDRLTDITLPDGSLNHIIFNDASRTVTTEITKNGITQRSIKGSNALGQTETITDNIGNVVHYTYDEVGRLLESWVNDDDQNKTIITYDDWGNRLSISDPDAGVITNTYDALGQVVTQTNARNQITTFVYDDLGRIEQETSQGAGMATEVVLNDYLSSGVAIGKLNWIKLNGETRESYSYDDMGRMNSNTEIIDSESFTHSNTYDDYGRVASQSYPSGYTIGNTYNDQGDLWQITHDNQVIYENEEFDALGAITDYNYNDEDFIFSRAYDEMGRLESMSSDYQDLYYEYDDMGNMSTRGDVLSGKEEVFAYDELKRLSNINIYDGISELTHLKKHITYDATGNILSKTDVGADIRYGDNADESITAGPHALTSINIPMGYQPNRQDISYTYFNKAKLVTQGDYTYEYTYGIDHQRRKTVYKCNSITKRTKYYVGNYEKVIKENGDVVEYNYLGANAGIFGIFVKTNGVGKLYYTLTDHLGSLTKVIDATTKQEVQSLSFSAWGIARDDSWAQEYKGDLFADRGFTGHEHLPSVFGLIDMNGRMYDPVLGRMLSPDPYVQAPDYAQNFNRYAYCLNNPLSYTDPDGELFFLAAAALTYFTFFTDIGYEVQKYVSPVAIKFDAHLSSEQKGVGANISGGVPKSMGVSYRFHAGATYYADYYDDGFSGWETRYGGEWTVGGVHNYSQTHFSNNHKQTTGIFTIGIPSVNLKYENDHSCNFMDWLPGLPSYESHEDRWRSGAAQLNVFGLKAGVNIGNGQRSFKNDELGKVDEDGFYREGEDPFRAGVWYFGVGSLRFGRNSENFRANVQNTIHDWIDDKPYRQDPDFNNHFYWYFGTGSGNTLW